MASPSQTLKKAHRKHGTNQSLKAFTRELSKNDKQQKDVVTAWTKSKDAHGKRQKKGAAKPRVEAAPPAKAQPPRKR
jgi:hypothetical protein